MTRLLGTLVVLGTLVLALAQIAVESASDIRKGLDELTSYNRKRVEEGAAAEGDLIRVKIERDRAAIEETVARMDSARAAAQLGTYLGTSTGSSPLLVSRAVFDVAAAAAPLPGRDELFAQARSRQPALVAARARAAAARAELGYQRRLSVRQIGATFGTKRIAGESSMIAGITLPLPLFDRNQGEIARSAGERTAAEKDAEWAERSVLARLEGAYEAARLLDEELRTLEPDLVRRAEEARAVSLASYREGAATLLQVLDASRTLGEVRVISARLLFSGRESRLELDAASGADALTSLSIPAEPARTEGKR